MAGICFCTSTVLTAVPRDMLNVVIVGGGATGVEIAGALSEMKRYVIPYDYPFLRAVLCVAAFPVLLLLFCLPFYLK